MITPTVLLLTGVGFFSLILFGEPLTPLLAQAGMTPLLAAVYVGALQNIFSKSAKYSLFDPCKEMAYIPLDEEMKVWINFVVISIHVYSEAEILSVLSHFFSIKGSFFNIWKDCFRLRGRPPLMSFAILWGNQGVL